MMYRRGPLYLKMIYVLIILFVCGQLQGEFSSDIVHLNTYTRQWRNFSKTVSGLGNTLNQHALTGGMPLT